MIMKTLIARTMMVLLVAAGAFSSVSQASEQSLFINLTSNELNRAAMAISFGHKVLAKKKMPVAIFLNVEGVHLANRDMPQNVHSSGKTLRQMLDDFMADGGQVIVCPMCMKNVGGMGEEDLIEGAVLGGPNTTWKALFADEVTVLSY
jgi:predicted peroxiredoxin